MFRTDQNNNPTAFTVDIAIQAGLVLNADYVIGTKFPEPSQFYTAKLLGDPIAVTIKVIDAIGYYTRNGDSRWSYIAIPSFVWATLNLDQRRDVIGFHYWHEGGTAMRHLFPNYGMQ